MKEEKLVKTFMSSYKMASGSRWSDRRTTEEVEPNITTKT